jgi:predicted transcriptional regulator
MYRKQHDLLTPAEIISIREQYGLATKSFAKILGLGEISITRYENGHVQEEAQNNLILLMKSKAAFTQLYEKNKHRLTDKEVEKVDGILSKCQLLVSWGGKQYSPKNAAKAQYPAIQCADSQSVKCLVTQSA